MSRTAITLNLGRDDTFAFQATNADGSARSLAGCDVLLSVKADDYSAALIGIGIGSGITVTDLANGKFSALVTAGAKTAANITSAQSYLWDVLVIDAGGYGTTPPGLTGDAIVLGSVTTNADGATQQTPTAQPTNFFYHPEITALTGGGSAALDGYETAALSYPCIFLLRIAGQRQEWLLRAKVGGDTVDDPGAIAAADLNTVQPASNANLIWERNE